MGFETTVAKKFLAFFGPPQTDDPETFFSEWKRRCEGRDAEILMLATNVAVDRHNYQSWPTIGEFLEALKEVSARIAACRMQVMMKSAEKDWPGLGAITTGTPCLHRVRNAIEKRDTSVRRLRARS